MEKIGGIHGMRHAYATHQLEVGLPVHRLQRLLAHQDIHYVGQQQPEPTADAGHPAPFDDYPCSKCRQGYLRIIAYLPPKRDEGG